MKIIKKYNNNLKARIDKELYLYNVCWNHCNAKFYGIVEHNKNIYTIYTENYGTLLLINVVTWTNIVNRNCNDDGYNIEYKRFTRTTGIDKKELNDNIFKKRIKLLIENIEYDIEDEKKK